jgi:hypothetical protein
MGGNNLCFTWYTLHFADYLDLSFLFGYFCFHSQLDYLKVVDWVFRLEPF